MAWARPVGGASVSTFARRGLIMVRQFRLRTPIPLSEGQEQPDPTEPDEEDAKRRQDEVQH